MTCMCIKINIIFCSKNRLSLKKKVKVQVPTLQPLKEYPKSPVKIIHKARSGLELASQKGNELNIVC